MNCLGRSELNERIRLMRLRSQGIQDAPDPEEEICDKLSEMDQKTAAVVEELFSRLQESTDQIASLTEKVVEALSSRQTPQDSEEKLLALKVIQQQFKDSLLKMRAEIAEEKKQKAELFELLAHLRKKLKDAPSPLNSFVQGASQRVSYYGVTGKAYSEPANNRTTK